MLKQDVLFEIGCEELPVKMVLPLAEELALNMQNLLHDANLSFDSMQHFATPRRLALKIIGLQLSQANQLLVRKGPAKQASFDVHGQPTQALLGFARSCDVDVSDIKFQRTEKGEWAVVEKEVLGNSSYELLPKFFKQALEQLSIPKPMYWGDHIGPFVRPVHWVVALLGDRVLPGEYFGVQAGRNTYGHRYHFPDARVVPHPDDYEPLLRSIAVEPCFTTRRTQILALIQQQASLENASVVMHEGLLDEVTSIVEEPVALTIPFSQDFLQLPEEVLIESMHVHQKCFAMRDVNGKLMAKFITIANIRSLDPDQVIAGNAKVMRARLSDAKFFYEQDQKQPLIKFQPKLKQTLFQAKLGTLFEQCERMKSIVPCFAHVLDNSNKTLDLVYRAIDLSKCDLMTGMVGEFPELQGVIGSYYACHDGESPEISIAIQEQYYPRFAQDKLPSSSLGWLLSVLNRLDTLIGIFGIGQKPTGMKDPYKLRRHALALIRLALHRSLPLPLSKLLQTVVTSYPEKMLHADTASEVHSFILERLPAYWSGQGISADIIQAAMAVQTEWLDDLDARIHALHQNRSKLTSLLVGVKRVSHFLKHPDAQIIMPVLNDAYFTDASEIELYNAIKNMQQDVETLLKAREYIKILHYLDQLRPLIDAFFAEVMVMTNDLLLRNQRIALLQQLSQLLNCVGDLSILL